VKVSLTSLASVQSAQTETWCLYTPLFGQHSQIHCWNAIYLYKTDAAATLAERGHFEQPV